MRDQIYVTDLYSIKDIENFCHWLDNYIGVDYERECGDDGTCCLTIFDLNFKEVGRIRYYENKYLANNKE